MKVALFWKRKLLCFTQRRLLTFILLCKFQFTKYDEAARALGTNGATISRHSEVNRFKEVLKEAVEKCRPPNGQSTMINVLIGKTDFREGSISV